MNEQKPLLATQLSSFKISASDKFLLFSTICLGFSLYLLSNNNQKIKNAGCTLIIFFGLACLAMTMNRFLSTVAQPNDIYKQKKANWLFGACVIFCALGAVALGIFDDNNNKTPAAIATAFYGFLSLFGISTKLYTCYTQSSLQNTFGVFKNNEEPLTETLKISFTPKDSSSDT